ncbi:hypothetical protein Desaci_4731 (plasmid) [Desulfosporosinus acidiphilus SJ4]|uniref:Uncharacterized protein n=1 Tax=Desulfosporosinus acidiphilus (strain DSM 22704 / JCM 16185 / SJ4) TaxID=646529 RepID=I4DCN4_DESAJ|nr:hypothetical protein [Desulfosporosinus acidiphilus]AFM43558.1 hypothetical protein Desaci_4731 [Desulfosporosinus acidiphilus SJ4]
MRTLEYAFWAAAFAGFGSVIYLAAQSLYHGASAAAQIHMVSY